MRGIGQGVYIGINNMPKEKFIITFAGPMGCSKTPVAYYLSWKLNLPILNNDAIRTEVIEDLGRFSEAEYLKRRDERIKENIEKERTFIYDASVDRAWKDWADNLEGYDVFIISFDFSKNFLLKLYTSKGYDEAIEEIDRFMADHEKFINQFGDKVDLRITDENFKNRLKLSLDAVEEWMGK